MVLMLQPVPVAYLLAFSTAIIIALFIARMYFLRRILIRDIKGKPIVLALGFPKSGKTTLLRRMAADSGTEMKSYSFKHNMEATPVSFSYKDFRFITMPGLLKEGYINEGEIKPFSDSLKLITYIVDLSPSSKSIEEQSMVLEKVRSKFRNVPILVVGNKKEIAKKDKLNEFNRRFGKESLKLSLVEKDIKSLKSAMASRIK